MDVEDAVHDALLEIWDRWREHGPEPITVPFFLVVVKRRLLNRRRAERRKQSVPLDDAAGELDALAVRAHTMPSRVETAGDVLDLAFATMPPKRREALLLTRVHDYTYKEAGTVLRVSEQTVKTHVRLGSADVRRAFEGSTFKYATMRPPQLRAPTETEDPAHD
jgi:RNA polymerase sigma factor (sigma-70 family)